MTQISLIGAGENAAGHARYYSECDRANVAGIFDPDVDRARHIAAMCGAEIATSLEQAIEMADAVVIASPNPFHADQAVRAAVAGRHVFIEKPMALNLHDARHITAAVHASGVASCVGFATRFTSEISTAISMAEAGVCGELRSLWARRTFAMDLSRAPAWRRDPARSGGLLMEINVHELDWLLYLGGQPISVYAVTRADDDHPSANDDLWFTIKFENGCVATHEGSWTTTVPNFYRGIRGSEGGLATDEWGGSLQLYRPGVDRSAVDTPNSFDLRSHWLDAIQSGSPCIADAQWGCFVTAVAEAIMRSAAINEVISLAEVLRPRSPHLAAIMV